MYKIKYILLIFLTSLLGVISLSHLVSAADETAVTMLPTVQTDGTALPDTMLTMTDTLAYGFTNFGEFYRFSLNAPTLTQLINYISYSIEASDFVSDDFTIIYGLSTYGDFYQFDTGSGAETFITYTLPISTLQWTGMAWNDAMNGMYVAGYFDPLFSCSAASQSLLYMLDVTTGAVSAPTVIANVPCLAALAAGPDGLFYGLEAFFNQLVVFDATGNVVTAVPMPFLIDAHHGLDFDASTGLLYATTTDEQFFSSQLWVIDPETLIPLFAGFLGYGDGQQFSSLSIASMYEAPAAEGEIDPQQGGVLEYVDPLGSVTRIEAPPGAVTRAVRLAFSPIIAPGFPPPTGTQFVNHNFELTANVITGTGYQLYLPVVIGTEGYPGRVGEMDALSRREVVYDFVFLRPLTFTIYYTDTDLSGSPEDSLHLLYWDGSNWVDAIQTCVDVGILPDPRYIINLDENYIQLPVCHLTRFGLVGN